MVLEKRAAPLKTEASLSYNRDSQLFELRFRAMATDCSVKFVVGSEDRASLFAKEVVQWVTNFESKYSRFRDTSLISEINRQAGDDWVAIDAEMESICAICDDLNFMTQGVLDPTALPLMKIWDYRKTRDELPSQEAIDAARKLVGWSLVERRPGKIRLPRKGMALDFGGFGKEYAVDKVAALAVERGIVNCLVDLGRDIHILGTPPGKPGWHVALENPDQPGSAWASLACTGGGIATSGDYCRFFEHGGQRYGHIIDPRLGRPVRNEILAVTIVANSCLEAGVFSTAAFVLGQEEGLDLIESALGCEGSFALKNGIRQSRNFYNYVVQ